MSQQTLAEAPPANEGAALDDQRALVFERARNLDQFGRRVERFLSLQLQQLEAAVNDFERERSAWRRQRQRELEQIELQRKELEHAAARKSSANPAGRDHSGKRSPLFGSGSHAAGQRRPEAVQGSGSAPLRMLLQPGSAGTMRLGLLMFEISKLNRELGGDGVRFEVNECRQPSKGQGVFDWEGRPAGAIVVLEVFSCAPLLRLPPGDARTTDHLGALACWEEFKSTLVLSSAVDEKLQRDFRKLVDTPRDHECRLQALEASRRADDANTKCLRSDGGFGPVLQSGVAIDAAEQQLKRLKTIIRCLAEDCGLRLHISLV